MDQKPTVAKRKEVIKVYLTTQDFGEILQSSQMAGLSLSTYARKVCLGSRVESRTDHMTRLELARIRGDIGKLGGLMKQALAQGVSGREAVHRALREFDAVKSDIKRVLEALANDQ